jgi:hypothetical protein
MALEAVMDARAWRDGIYASTAVPGGMYAASARCDEWPSEYPRVAERRAHRQRVFSDEVNRHMPISRTLFRQGRGADLLVNPAELAVGGGYNISPRWAIRALAGGETRDGSFSQAAFTTS